jgi:hypothetical protein
MSRFAWKKGWFRIGIAARLFYVEDSYVKNPESSISPKVLRAAVHTTARCHVRVMEHFTLYILHLTMPTSISSLINSTSTASIEVVMGSPKSNRFGWPGVKTALHR